MVTRIGYHSYVNRYWCWYLDTRQCLSSVLYSLFNNKNVFFEQAARSTQSCSPLSTSQVLCLEMKRKRNTETITADHRYSNSFGSLGSWGAQCPTPGSRHFRLLFEPDILSLMRNSVFESTDRWSKALGSRKWEWCQLRVDNSFCILADNGGQVVVNQ